VKQWDKYREIMLRNRSIFQISTLVCLSPVSICNLFIDLTSYFPKLHNNISSRDSVVGITTGYGVNDRGVKEFLFSTSSIPALWSTQPPIQWVLGTFSLGMNWPGRETDHSPPASVEVKKTCLYKSVPHTPS
jgi:hypothetical protein